MHEFEGKTVEEAIQKAIDELDLTLSNIDVEILEEKKGFFGTTRYARIRVSEGSQAKYVEKKKDITSLTKPEQKTIEFVNKLLHYFDVSGKVEIENSTDAILDLSITSSNPSILIGKNGNTFVALQTLISAASRGLGYEKRVRIDIENYRMHQQEKIRRQVQKIIQQVRRSKKSVFMPPMNPQERRIVHEAVADVKGIATMSGGEKKDYIKRVEIFIDES